MDELYKQEIPTPTEKRVLQELYKGLSNLEIAYKLGVGKRTVETHVSNLLAKSKTKNRTALVRWAIENELL